MNPVKKMEKEIRIVEKELHNATKNAQTDQGFLGIIYNHFEGVSADLIFIEEDIEKMRLSVIQHTNGKLKLIYDKLERLERKITDKALTKKQSQEYQDMFSKLHAEYEEIIKKTETQINTREKLISSIDNHLGSFKRHKKVIRRASRRGLQFENRFGKNVEGALKAVEHLLSLEVSSRINNIKNPTKNIIAPFSRYYGKMSRVEAMKERRKSESTRGGFNVKV